MNVGLGEDRNNVATLQLEILRRIVLQDKFAEIEGNQGCFQRFRIDSLHGCIVPIDIRSKKANCSSLCEAEVLETQSAVCCAPKRNLHSAAAQTGFDSGARLIGPASKAASCPAYYPGLHSWVESWVDS